MSFQEQVAKDMLAILGAAGQDGLVEALTVNGTTEVSGFVSREASPQKGNEISSDGWAARANIFIAADALLTKPQRGDMIEDSSGATWRVIAVTPLPGIYQMSCVADENPWG
jgi:hypothetical protein